MEVINFAVNCIEMISSLLNELTPVTVFRWPEFQNVLSFTRLWWNLVPLAVDIFRNVFTGLRR